MNKYEVTIRWTTTAGDHELATYTVRARHGYMAGAKVLSSLKPTHPTAYISRVVPA